VSGGGGGGGEGVGEGELKDWGELSKIPRTVRERKKGSPISTAQGVIRGEGGDLYTNGKRCGK